MTLTLLPGGDPVVPSTLLPDVEIKPPGAQGVWFDARSRARIRATGRSLMRRQPDAVKLSQCGLPIPERGGGPGLILTEEGRIYGGQLVACRSPLRCAWCSPMQWDIAARVGLWYSNRLLRAGGWMAHTAVTIPHRVSTDLADSFGVLSEAWSGLRKSRRLTKARQQAGVLTAVPVLHVTWSPRSGWHPHLHVMWPAFGDPDCGDTLVEVVADAWRLRVENVVGRPVARSAPGSGGSVVMTAEGFWAYLAPDHPKHPDRDCNHSEHPGCEHCTAPTGGGSGDDGSWWGSGNGFHPEPEPDELEEWGREWDREWDEHAPGMEVLSGVGAAAAAGNLRAGAVLREYLTATARRSRIVSTWRELKARFGDPPVETRSPPKRREPKRRVWLHPRLVAAIELRRRRHDRGWVSDGLRVAAGDAPWEAAHMWSEVTGETVVVNRHDDDGAPVVGFAGDLVGVSNAKSKYPH